MKQTPLEIEIQKRLEPGVVTLDGFLGNDPRHYHEIIEEDKAILEKLGLNCEQIAEKMQYFTDQAFECYDSSLIIEDKYSVEYISERGKIISPFQEKGLFPKGLIIFKNLKNNIEIRWTPLNIHLIRKHCFFEGKGSKHRIDPIKLFSAFYE